METIIRVFEITRREGRLAQTIVEYFGPFVEWSITSTNYREKRMVGGQLWIFISKDYMSKYLVDTAVIMLENRHQQWIKVDLKQAGELPEKARRQTKDLTIRKK